MNLSRARLTLFLGGSALLFLLSLAALLLLWLARDLPPLEQLERYRPLLSSQVYASGGEPLGEFFEEKRSFVPLSRIPPHLVDALIATEDRRFRSHWGIDPQRVVAALLVDIRQMSYVQGASTITQQLARNLYLSSEKSITRKLREMLTAIQIERAYSKDEILEMYLTQAYFGHGAYGVQLASRRYFGRDVSEIRLHEAAMLVGLLKAPANYSPFFREEAARRRRATVLRLMEQDGRITQEQRQRAEASPLTDREYTAHEAGLKAPYFSENVRIELGELQEKLGVDIYRDGLRIHTTLDLAVQQHADSVMQGWLPLLDESARASFLEHDWEDWHWMTDSTWTRAELDSLKEDSLYVEELLRERLHAQGALVALDPSSGAVRAMIGGREFEDSKYNRVTQSRRQPGSAFKPVLYMTAIENGYGPSTRVLNQDVVVEESDGRRWTPQNYDDSRGGLTTLREGLQFSYNLVSVRLLMEIVPPRLVVEMARRLGITTRIETDYTMALGSSGVLPIELVSAYACIANHGVWTQPYSIERIEDRRGNLIYQHRARSRVAVSEGVAAITSDMLRTVIDRGSGGSARWKYKFNAPAAGKTGTTNLYTDAWFVGYTPRLAMGVWVGMDNPLYRLGEGQSGGRAALPVWAQVMHRIHDAGLVEREGFELPESVVRVELCKETMEKAGPLCPGRTSELFLREYRPLTSCSVHRYDY